MSLVSVDGIESTGIRLTNMADRSHRKMLATMRDYAELIRDRSILYAPIDEGYLEDAHEIFEERGGRNRVVIYVGIDPNGLGPGYQRWGFRYDIHTHENMSYPGFTGSIQPGEHSQAKGDEVGGKYLERAVDDYEAALQKEMREIAKAIAL